MVGPGMILRPFEEEKGYKAFVRESLGQWVVAVLETDERYRIVAVVETWMLAEFVLDWVKSSAYKPV